MDLPVNSFKRAIKAGRQQIGLWSSLASNITVEILAGSGFDWLLLDYRAFAQRAADGPQPAPGGDGGTASTRSCARPGTTR